MEITKRVFLAFFLLASACGSEGLLPDASLEEAGYEDGFRDTLPEAAAPEGTEITNPGRPQKQEEDPDAEDGIPGPDPQSNDTQTPSIPEINRRYRPTGFTNARPIDTGEPDR